jgi:cytochrome c biogenesis protein CcmG, thiol:disulfide interchange protein DsbE
MRRLLFILPVLLFAALAVWLGLGLTRDPGVLPSAMIGKPAPNFALTGLGKRPGLSKGDITGQVTLINFFASWCIPCRIEHPVLMQIAAEHRIPLYGIAYKDKEADAERLLDQGGDPYARIGIDPDGRTAIDFGVYGVPETYVTDREGRIRYRQVGPITPEIYEQTLAPLLKQLGAS